MKKKYMEAAIPDEEEGEGEGEYPMEMKGSSTGD